MWKWLSFLIPPFVLMAQVEMEPESMLFQAESIGQRYRFEVAKLEPPSLSPQPRSCLNTASIWFSTDLAELPEPAFDSLNDEIFWDLLREIGVQGVYLKGLKKGGKSRTGISLDPKWGTDWNDVALWLQKKKMALIGDSLGNCTGFSADFWLALKNFKSYAGLYHLIEIEKRDWNRLPCIGSSDFTANVPWLTLQELHKKGYVPEQFSPYVKKSCWNATAPVQCTDGKVRRWIYLQEGEAKPAIDWLSPSFGGSRIAAADMLDSIFHLGQKIAWIDDSIECSAKEMQVLWTRKLGGLSVLEAHGGLQDWKNASTDMISDTLTRPALLHALIAEDAEILKLMYRLFLEEGIETQRLVHTLQPFDAFTSDWAIFLANPKKRFKYSEEILTGEALRIRLLKEDAFRLKGAEPVTWPSACLTVLEEEDSGKKRESSAKAHLLLAFFYAMQPGVFSFSLSDLLGMVEHQTVDLMNPNEQSLYGSLPSQMKNSLSFAMQLKKILSVRTESSIEFGELLGVPETRQKGLLILIHRLRGGLLQLLAINFARTAATQVLEIPSIRQTTAIDLMTGLAEKKPLDSSTIRLDLPPLTGKAILFQTKYFDF